MFLPAAAPVVLRNRIKEVSITIRLYFLDPLIIGDVLLAFCKHADLFFDSQ